MKLPRVKKLEPKTINEQKLFFLKIKIISSKLNAHQISHIQAFIKYILLQNLECLAL